MTSAPSLEVVGPFRGSSGYDRHTREFVREFVSQGVSVRLIHLPGWSFDLPSDMRETWFDQLDSPVQTQTVLHFTMPNHARPQPGKRNVNYTMFEADRIPQLWVDCARKQDLIVVPTETSYRAWALSGVPERCLRISPLGVDGKFFSTPADPLRLSTESGRAVASYRYRFLNIAELRPRKNHLGLLRSWIRATKPDDDAVLVLKVSAVQYGVMQDFFADVAAMQQRLGDSLQNAAPVILLSTILSNERMRSLYASATHYLSMSHGEGWDQAMMEAATAGLELIAPRHSAYLSYLRDDEAHLFPATPKPVQFEGRMGMEDWTFFRGLNWWEPDEDAMVEIFRGIIDDTVRHKNSPQQRIVRDYTWEKAAKQLLQVLF